MIFQRVQRVGMRRRKMSKRMLEKMLRPTMMARGCHVVDLIIIPPVLQRMAARTRKPMDRRRAAGESTSDPDHMLWIKDRYEVGASAPGKFRMHIQLDPVRNAMGRIRIDANDRALKPAGRAP